MNLPIHPTRPDPKAVVSNRKKRPLTLPVGVGDISMPVGAVLIINHISINKSVSKPRSERLHIEVMNTVKWSKKQGINHGKRYKEV